MRHARGKLGQYLLPFPGRAMRRLNRRRCGPGASTLMWAMYEGYRWGEGRSREIKMGSYGLRACRPPALFSRKNRAGHVVRAARRGGSVATGFQPCLYPHLSEHGSRTSEARSTGLCPAKRGLAPALWAGTCLASTLSLYGRGWRSRVRVFVAQPPPSPPSPLPQGERGVCQHARYS